ncbi:hypothetical protein C4D60_Mb05t14920 [Musa balbisiana]|uniref:Uncharacterized protein n=1 Tax=Musa balbisiana TaxID=52838 RepID=A0A4S8JW85_MUSBA|nr:hypothetical protein C4D60_Mb05t14920 [Musa balbisiana]
MGERRERFWRAAAAVLVLSFAAAEGGRRHAYAAMMYMGTPRDYEFYVATRVMMRSLARLGVDADLVVIASADVPFQWVQTLKEEDGVKVVTVENLHNPYEEQGNFNPRFKLTMNKLYAWTLASYDRVVMLDSDNLFLHRTDELFQCGDFCAAFINPCVFHTGLFVLRPSIAVFKDMLHELQIGRENPDGADQGFLVSYFPDLLDRPMFHPPANGTKLEGTYRLPLGYQMDASYYYDGISSVVSVPDLKFRWNAVMYLGIAAITRLARPRRVKLCYNRRPDKSIPFVRAMLKVAALWSMFAAHTIPFFLIPRTVHPLLVSAGPSTCSEQLHLVRALAVFGYAFCCAPVVWASLAKVLYSLHGLHERETFFTRLGESTPLSDSSKLY